MLVAEIVIAAVVALLVVITVMRSVRIVPQARARNVERLGRYRKTLEPGMNFVLPMIDRVKPMIDLREQVVSFVGAPVITEDNLVVLIDTVLFFQVTDPRAADYEIVNYIQAIEQITATMLRSVIGSMDLEQTLTSRDKINALLRGVLDDASGKWGIRVTRVELKAIDPPKSVKDAMEKQMRAEREKRAAILTAEGVRASKILTAEGEKQSAILTAEGVRQAKILTAEGEAQAIERGVPGRTRQRPRPQAARLPVPADAAAARAGRGQHVLGHPERGHLGAAVGGERLRRRGRGIGRERRPGPAQDDRAQYDRADDRGPARAACRPRGSNRRGGHPRPGSRRGSRGRHGRRQRLGRRQRRGDRRRLGRRAERHAGGGRPRHEFRRSAGRDRTVRRRGGNRRHPPGRRPALGQRQRSGLRGYFSSRTSALPISAAMTMTASRRAGK